MISLKQTAIASLRDVLGRPAGSEKNFSEMTGQSCSWVRKASAGGAFKITHKAAQAVATATGVSMSWLLRNKPEDPLEQDDITPYTYESYERWIRSKPTTDLTDVHAAEHLWTIILSLCSSIDCGKQPIAIRDLSQFAKAMESTYGMPQGVESPTLEIRRIMLRLRNIANDSYPEVNPERPHRPQETD